MKSRVREWVSSGSASLLLGATNLAVVLVIVAFTALSKRGELEGIHSALSILLLPLYWWTLSSWAPALLGMGLGIEALSRRKVLWGGAGLALNGALLSAYAHVVWRAWPALMGV